VVEAEEDDAAPCDGVLSGCEFHRSPQQSPVSTASVQPLRKRKVARSNRGTGHQTHCPLAGWSGRQALNLERRRFETFEGSQNQDPGELPAWPLRFERRKIQVRHLGPEPSCFALCASQDQSLDFDAMQDALRSLGETGIGTRLHYPDVAQGDAGGLKARFLGVRVPASGPPIHAIVGKR
jgi:hypothetical protein